MNVSHDQNLFDNKWCSVRERVLDNGVRWVYGTHPWCQGSGVVILPFRRVVTKPEWSFVELRYLVREELCPAHIEDGFGMYAVAGGLDKPGELPEEAAVRELLEETGYQVAMKDLIYLETARPSKGTDTLMYLFAVDVTNLTPGEVLGDGTLAEELASSKWVSGAELIMEGEPLLTTLFSRHSLVNAGFFRYN